MTEAIDTAWVEFRGDAGTPVRYEDIKLGRDVVFLRWDRRHDEENVAIGAPPIETFYYTGFLREREGTRFVMTYFSLAGSRETGRLPGTGILLDGGCAVQCMAYEESNMRFWRVGELWCDRETSNGEDGA